MQKYNASTTSYGEFQLFLLTLMGLTYYWLEKRGYLINVDAFRPVIACIATLHAGGAVCAVGLHRCLDKFLHFLSISIF